MSKFISDSSHDAKLENIRTATAVHICTGDPADRTAVLANTIGNFSPTFTAVANGGAGVRRTTTLQQATGVLIGNGGGTAATLCAIDATELLEKTDITGTPALSDGQSVTVNAHTIDSLDES